MKSTLSLYDAIRLLMRGEPCTITVCTLDQRRETGGDRKIWHDVRILTADNPGLSDTDTAAAPAGQPAPGSKHPNHPAHSTFNIRLANEEIMKIHLPLLERINGQRIAL